MNASYLENVCFYLAARKVGAIFIPVNVRLVAREVEYIVINSDTEYLVYGQEYETLVDQIRGKVPQLKKIICIEKEGKAGSGMGRSLRTTPEKQRPCP